MARRKKDSVQPGKNSCDKVPDRNNGTKLIVINGIEVLQFLDSEYHLEHSAWERSCDSLRKSFRKKTSRSIKNDKEYETTRWYRVMPDGSMKSTGSSEEPDYSEFYTTEPKPRYGFTVWVPEIRLQRDEHIVIEEKDYKENLKIFKDCLVFRLSNCENYMHPLHANPDKVLSVRDPAKISAAREDRTNRAFYEECDEDPHFIDMSQDDEEEDEYEE